MKELTLEEKVQRALDYRELENLANRYDYLLCAVKYEEVVPLFAIKTPGVHAEIANQGVYEGEEGIKKLYIGVHGMERDNVNMCLQKGFLYSMWNVNPIIEIAGDGKTAKGLWLCAGHETLKVNGKLEALWQVSHRGMDFIREGGVWKIWHYHVYGILHASFYKSWADSKGRINVWDAQTQLPEDLRPDKPSVWDHEYDPEGVFVYGAPMPVPYNTFDESTAY